MNNQNQQVARQMFIVMLISIGLSFALMNLLFHPGGSQHPTQPSDSPPLRWSYEDNPNGEEVRKKATDLARETLDVQVPRSREEAENAIKTAIQSWTPRNKDRYPDSEIQAARWLRAGVLCQRSQEARLFRNGEDLFNWLSGEARLVDSREFGNQDDPTRRFPATTVFEQLLKHYPYSVLAHTAQVHKYLAVPPQERVIGTAPFKEFEGYVYQVVDRREHPHETPHVPVFLVERGQFQVAEYLEVAARLLEPEYQKGWRYQMMDFLVKLLRYIPGTQSKSSPFSAQGLAIILFAVLVRLALAPLTHAQFRAMKDMQKKMPAFQAEMKKLQEKYKDRKDQMKMYQEMRALQKKHGVNPFGNVGCLLMLIQMPILFTLYYVIQHYQFQFQNAHFLWMSNLARPDLYLIGLYVLSMILQSKLISMTQPPPDPEQAQMQKMMTYLMPILFAFIFKGFPAALILYWFTFNVIYTAQQYIVMREGQGTSQKGLSGIMKTLNPLASSSNGSGASVPDEEVVPPRPDKEKAATMQAGGMMSGRKAKRKRRRR
ncbi:MAG: YidC/Oxa1 family membrane protein insertase [Abditibacteriales bacterium]|nr:YidC/Oxa1 family membrane protein insertase [Abditibacteriales bacterium]MDW8366118.1 YidC/Oxa1 family membrane protein insertase [Abditibacteriales bacterium]